MFPFCSVLGLVFCPILSFETLEAQCTYSCTGWGPSAWTAPSHNLGPLGGCWTTGFGPIPTGSPTSSEGCAKQQAAGEEPKAGSALNAPNCSPLSPMLLPLAPYHSPLTPNCCSLFTTCYSLLNSLALLQRWKRLLPLLLHLPAVRPASG